MKTREAEEIATLDFLGYKLAPTQADLTLQQKIFILDAGIRVRNKIYSGEEDNSSINKDPGWVERARQKHQELENS